MVAYGEALEQDDAAAAWELLDPAVQQQLTRAGFEERWQALRLSEHKAAGEMAATADTPARLRATLDYSPYDRLQLRLTEEGWRITRGVLAVASQRTPHDTLVGFVRALESRNPEALLRFVPSAYAQHMTPALLQADLQARDDELQELVAALQAALNNPIQERGGRAWMRYGDREITFIREGELWKVEDPD